jgi:hypothetical protein
VAVALVVAVVMVAMGVVVTMPMTNEVAVERVLGGYKDRKKPLVLISCFNG